MTCTFFGNRDASAEVFQPLQKTIIELIEGKNVTEFYVGTHGKFDKMVYEILSQLESVYHFKFSVVLAYLNQNEYPPYHTLYPEGIEKVPLRFAILWRNKWMLEKADFVVTYTKNTTGGTWMMKELAQKKMKRIIELA